MRHQSLPMSHGPRFTVFHAPWRTQASAFRCYNQLRFQQFRALEAHLTLFCPPSIFSLLLTYFKSQVLSLSFIQAVLPILLCEEEQIHKANLSLKSLCVEIEKSPFCSGCQEGMNGQLDGQGSGDSGFITSCLTDAC